MAAGQDAIIAQLMEMGFDSEAIEEYQIAMTTSTEGLSMQAATEWLLQRSQRQSTRSGGDASTLTLSPSSLPPHPPLATLSPHGDVQKAMSSGGVLTSYSQPLKSRYDLGEEHAREKERYAAKEREDVIRKSKERKLADTKAKNLIKQQIADDRKARVSRGKVFVPSATPSGSQHSAVGERGGGEGGGEIASVKKSTSSTCRLQIRLPSGRVLRHSLPSSALLSDVAQFVMTSAPKLTNISLVQPFPHHQFTSDEMSLSLLSLGLCPSASLVIPRQTGQSGPTTGQSSSATGQLPISVFGQADSATGHFGSTIGQTGSATGQSSSGTEQTGSETGQSRHISGQAGSATGQSSSATPSSTFHGQSMMSSDVGSDYNVRDAEQMDVTERVNVDKQPGDHGVNEDIHHQGRVDVEMEDESHSHSGNDDEMEPESDEDEIPRGHMNLPPRPNFAPPYPQRMPNFGRPHPQLRPPRAQFPGFPPLGGEEIFGGEGHILGGKEAAIIGDAQLVSEQGGHVAARKRTKVLESPHLTDRVVRHFPSVPSLVTLCTRTLVGLTASYALPSCASLPPRPAHILLDALRTQGRLNTKTLAAFHGCPLQSMVLDNYPYSTNELVGALWHFSSLTRLSLSSCTLITDKAITSLFPYLSRLTDLNLEGCRQLTDAIFRPIRCCISLETLSLCQVKATDRGIGLLLHTPLTRLTRLNLSHTRITSTTLAALPRGTPALEELAIESTEVTDLTALCRLPQLHTLSIAHCNCGSGVGSLSGCGQLRSLNVSGVSISPDTLSHIQHLSLTSLTLPDRATFSDVSMEAISKFPLTSLNLMDYCYVSDVGVANIVSMTTLTTLTLSKTKLTDTGMHCVAALPALRHLSIDNTVVTDAGLMLIAGLVCLESLSLSDTRVTSDFILLGALDGMGRLAKLNLSRTAVCDKGLLRLCLPSLIMLNLDWTCVTEAISLTYLTSNGCPLLHTLRNRNIGQPLPQTQD